MSAAQAPAGERVAIVTGATRGIGYALTEALLRDGMTVYAVGVDAARVADVAARLGHPRLRARRADVADLTAWDGLFREVLETHGRVDWVVNNAGILGGGELADMDDARLQRLVGVNLWGVIHGSRLAASILRRQRHGKILNVASMAGVLPVPFSAVYTATKHAVYGFSLALREELAPHGVAVHVVCPDLVDTTIFDRPRHRGLLLPRRGHAPHGTRDLSGGGRPPRARGREEEPGRHLHAAALLGPRRAREDVPELRRRAGGCAHGARVSHGVRRSPCHDRPRQGERRMTDRHKKKLVAIGLLVALGVPTVLAGWVAAVRLGGLDLVLGCHLAGVSSMLLLGTSIVLPFLVDAPREARVRGFVVVWFAMSAGFNLAWELPLVVFRSTLTSLEFSAANLPLGIAWWGYTLSDAHYRDVTPFMVTIELTWLVANAMAAFGLNHLRRGKETTGYLWLGVAGALQAYNAGLYVVANGVMDHYANVATDSVLAPLLYWGFNTLWTGAAVVGSVLAFRLMLAIHSSEAAEVAREGSGRRLEALHVREPLAPRGTAP